MRSLTQRALWLPAALLAACAGAPRYPAAGPGADTELMLESNMPDTEYSIDGRVLAKGSRALILVDSDKSYRIAAKPAGYNAKEEFIQPPYRPPNRLAYFFMLGDKTFRDAPLNRSAAGKAPVTPAKDVVSYDQRSAKGHVIVEGGIDERGRALKVIGQVCSTKNLALVSGDELLQGGVYKVTDESLQDGLYRVEFACVY